MAKVLELGCITEMSGGSHVAGIGQILELTEADVNLELVIGLTQQPESRCDGVVGLILHDGVGVFLNVNIPKISIFV